MTIPILAIALLLATETPADLPCQDRLFAFEVEDQFEDERTEADLLGTVSVLIWSDRGASDHTASWRDLLEPALRGQLEAGLVQIRGWAHTKGAPFFVKGRIRRSFSDDPAQWSFLDWDGVFRERYEPVEDHVNVFVFDREGCLVARDHGREATPRQAAHLAHAAQRVLVRDAARDADR